jgi:DNA topoisomerase-3
LFGYIIPHHKEKINTKIKNHSDLHAFAVFSQKGIFMSILVIGEKPSVSKELAKVLGAGNSKKTYIEGNGYIVSWCFGHLVGLKYPNDYNNGWQEKWSFSQLPMIPDKWLFKVADGTKAQFNVLKDLMNRADVTEIICATDADREGECIFRYVYNMAKCGKPVKRLWVSSLEESAIRSALGKMKSLSDYDNLYAAGYARAKADWLVGMNGSRLFSCRYRDRLNVGRVQTPTLAMIVKRDSDVKNFVKQKYFTADLNCGNFTLSSARIDDEKTIDSLVSACNGDNITIGSIKREVKTVNPPKLYDLTTLQREANKVYGYTAQQTLDYIQSLYEGKLATYPRTDSHFLSDDMKETAIEIVREVGNIFEFGSVANPNIDRCINNSKVTGHHAIIPTTNIATADLTSLPKGERNVLTLIANRLLCAVDVPHKYESVKITAVCNDTEFTANGKTVLDIGWKRFAIKSDEKEDTKTLPSILEGQQFPVTASKGEHFTSPPKPYTEDTLLSAMEHAGAENFDENSEKKGLGTPATRAGTIEGLVTKGYAERKGKQISATEKGVNLIAVVPDEVKSAKLTADWEMKLQQIEHGQYSADGFMGEIEQFIREICGKYSTVDMSKNFGNTAVSIGKCPKCGSDVIKGKFGYYCKKKCGMNVAKVYGVGLSENQIKGLLEGKSTSYISKGKKTTVLPEVVSNEYNGKTYYQWKTERKK